MMAMGCSCEHFLVWFVLRICAFFGGLSSCTFDIGNGKLWVKYSTYFTDVPFKRYFIKQIKSEISHFEICSASKVWILQTCTDFTRFKMAPNIDIDIDKGVN